MSNRPEADAGPVERSIASKLQGDFAPAYLDVVNESFMHSVAPGSETHFKVVVVSDRFAGMKPLERHRAVNAALAEELAAGLHALSVEARTPAEWQSTGGAVNASPKCLGGSKADSA